MMTVKIYINITKIFLIKLNMARDNIMYILRNYALFIEKNNMQSSCEETIQLTLK